MNRILSKDRKIDRNKSPGSLYEDVLNDDGARDAYMNTTQAVLTGDPNHKEMGDIHQALQDAAIAYLFTPNCRLPRPTLHSRQMIIVGKTNILAAIDRLSVDLH